MTTRRPSRPSQSGTRRGVVAPRQHVEGHRSGGARHLRRVADAAGQECGLALVEAHQLAGDEEVDRALEHGGDLVLGMLVLLPARARPVPVQRRGQLRRVDGGALNPGTYLGEVALRPIDRPRVVHVHVLRWISVHRVGRRLRSGVVAGFWTCTAPPSMGNFNKAVDAGRAIASYLAGAYAARDMVGRGHEGAPRAR